MSTDPFRPSADSKNPRSWNRYTYVLGDPVNLNDPVAYMKKTAAATQKTMMNVNGTIMAEAEVVVAEVVAAIPCPTTTVTSPGLTVPTKPGNPVSCCHISAPR